MKNENIIICRSYINILLNILWSRPTSKNPVISDIFFPEYNSFKPEQ